MDIKRATKGFGLSFVFLLACLYALSGIKYVLVNTDVEVEALQPQASLLEAVIKQDIQDLTIDSKSALSVEIAGDESVSVLFEKDSESVLPIASLTKLMTAVVVLDNYNLSEIISVSKSAFDQAPLVHDLKTGQKFSVSSLLSMMLVSSSNRAAYAIAERNQGMAGVQEFVYLMNQKAQDLGLLGTHFTDPTGLNIKNVSTAKDLSKLAVYILKKYPYITSITRLEKVYIDGFGEIKNTNDLLSEVPQAVCSKTGYTNDALGCLLLVVKNQQSGNYIVNIILGSENRFEEMHKMINWSNKICN